LESRNFIVLQIGASLSTGTVGLNIKFSYQNSKFANFRYFEQLDVLKANIAKS